MADYGHDLHFGLFATPSAHDHAAVVDLAVRADRAGLDLVTYQDHPYQPTLLDTWTLMSYVAASTERIRIAPNVVNLPLRSPAVLARAAASLDVLSGGRFELALGAGSFWDAIVAMGGPRRTPGQALAALREAIGIIRQVWDTSARGGVKAEGEFYRVMGAKRGPEPAHPIGIWLGALGPRMLALTGELADGWLPSFEYLPDGLDSLSAMNERIDAAAEAAGRPPGAVRRYLNVMNVSLGGPGGGRFLHGPVEQWIDELSDAALTHGVGGFLIGGDDARLVDVLAAEIAPAVRGQVADHRGTTRSPPGGSAGTG